MAVSDEEVMLRRKLAIMCRVLGMQDSIGLYGHVSIRVPGTDTVLMTPGAGIEKTEVRTDQIFVFDLAGNVRYHPGGDMPIQLPAEWRIHTQIHKDRPELQCVAHLHAWHSTLLGIARKEIVPVYSQAGFLKEGVPTWDDPRMVLSDEAAVALSRTLGKNVACQMRGHGSVVVGETVESALGACTFLEENARYQVEAETLGGAKAFPPEMWGKLLAERKGDWGNRLVWQYWERKVQRQGIPL
jgi:ribulose-5-phosphate 4-epimerase/fuculose-1-phosphate aldolase